MRVEKEGRDRKSSPKLFAAIGDLERLLQLYVSHELKLCLRCQFKHPSFCLLDLNDKNLSVVLIVCACYVV